MKVAVTFDLQNRMSSPLSQSGRWYMVWRRSLPVLERMRKDEKGITSCLTNGAGQLCSECVVFWRCGSLSERAPLHPVLLALSVPTLVADPRLPERLDVQPVVDQRHVHLQQHSTVTTDSTASPPPPPPGSQRADPSPGPHRYSHQSVVTVNVLQHKNKVLSTQRILKNRVRRFFICGHSHRCRDSVETSTANHVITSTFTS